MKVRLAEERDIPQIHDLLSQVANRYTYDALTCLSMGRGNIQMTKLKEILHDKQRPVFAAVDENDCLQGYAFCIFQQHLNDNILTDIKTLYIDDLCVDETKRGMHIGKTIYEAVLAFAKEQGCYNVTLNVWSCNESAMKFYQSCGLKPRKSEWKLSSILQNSKERHHTHQFKINTEEAGIILKAIILFPVSSVFLFNISSVRPDTSSPA